MLSEVKRLLQTTVRRCNKVQKFLSRIFISNFIFALFCFYYYYFYLGQIWHNKNSIKIKKIIFDHKDSKTHPLHHPSLNSNEKYVMLFCNKNECPLGKTTITKLSTAP